MKTKVSYLLLLFLVFSAPYKSYTQTDSLINLLNQELEDSVRIDVLVKISYVLYKTNPDSSIYYSLQILETADKGGIRYRYGNAYRFIGLAQSRMGNLNEALDYFNLAYDEFVQVKDTSGMSMVLNSIGIVYRKQGRYEKAIEYYLKALKLKEEQRHLSAVAILYNNIGIIYKSLENYDEAIEYFNKCINLRIEINDTSLNGNPIAGLASIYRNLNEYDLALKNYLKAMNYFRENDDNENLAKSYNNIGELYTLLHQYDTALHYLGLAEDYFVKTDGQDELSETYIYLGKVHTLLKKYKTAHRYLEKARQLSNMTGSMDNQMHTYFNLSMLDSAMGNYKQSLEHFKKYSAVKDSIFNKDKSKIITQLQTLYDLEKAEKENLILKQDQVLKEEHIKQQNIINLSIGIGLILVIFIAIQLFLSVRKTKKANTLLAQQKKEIDDSILYSKHIQNAVLPSRETIKDIIPESFIFYRPKGIIGGDFYWVAEQKDKTIISVADCTGHGVPGALMSMIGITFLNEIIINKGITNPAEILTRLRKRVINALHQTESEENAQDGMDIALCVIDRKNNMLEFAGANNPLLIERNGEITELKPDKMPVRYYHMVEKNFTLNEVRLSGNETIYLFSDGFADQFGGAEGKKYLKNNFRNLLSQISAYPLNEQEERLTISFIEWMGNTEQVDDVTVLGFSI